MFRCEDDFTAIFFFVSLGEKTVLPKVLTDLESGGIEFHFEKSEGGTATPRLVHR